MESTTKIAAPEGMLKAFREVHEKREAEYDRKALEAALLWLSENPILPTEEWAEYGYDGTNGKGHSATIVHLIGQWQRRMFLR